MTRRTLLLPALALLLAVGCDSADPVPPTPAATSVTVTLQEPHLLPGETTTASAAVRGTAGQPVSAPVEWTSENPAVASVDPAGQVRALAPGTAAIVARVGEITGQQTVTVYPAGTELRTFNVSSSSACETAQNRRFRRAATSTHAELWHDLNNPAGGFTDAEYAELGAEFDRVAWPTVVGTFGEPADIDGNGRVVVLYTRAVNELTAAGSNTLVGGFFFGRDLFPRVATPRQQACPTSNEAEMFYMLVPDPQGAVNNNVRTKELVRQTTVNTLTHELQHLVNASRRIFVNNASQFEALWLDEGLSHVSEELAFYRESGLGPRQNLTIQAITAGQATTDATNRYAVQNLSRISSYYAQPAPNSPVNTQDGLATRGAAWQLLRYLADRQPDERAFFRALGNARTAGFDNLANVLGTSPLPFMRDWAVAGHLDDTPGAADPRFRHLSWNFRSVLPPLSRNEGSFPLQIQTLAEGVERSAEVLAGSAAHFRFAAATAEPVRLRYAPGGGGAGGASCEGDPVQLAVGEAVQVQASAPRATCFAGAAGAEYAVTAFHFVAPVPLDPATNRPPTLVVTLRADGAAPPARPAAEAHAHLGPPLPPGVELDRGWERQLRELERRELGPRLRGGVSPTPAFRAAQDGPPLHVTVARLR